MEGVLTHGTGAQQLWGTLTPQVLSGDVQQHDLSVCRWKPKDSSHNRSFYWHCVPFIISNLTFVFHFLVVRQWEMKGMNPNQKRNDLQVGGKERKKGWFPCLCPPISVIEFHREEAVISSYPSFTSSPSFSPALHPSRWSLISSFCGRGSWIYKGCICSPVDRLMLECLTQKRAA